MLALRRAERRLSWDANVVRSRMRIWGQGTISIVPTFVPTLQTDGHSCAQPATYSDHD